ncbi:MAG: DUF1501 domain-containing protein [Planctomycetes bacterium]|nr:DUF1501 domain-containing protein [Planctomycetota bacterium]
MLPRRQFLKTTTLGALGLSLPSLLRLDAKAIAGGRARAKSMIFLFLYGGPSHIDIWDMKPDAPSDFRGEFQPTQTTVPGLEMVELLPRMARMARHFSVIRSLHHVNRNHQPAACWMLTGTNPQNDNTAQLRPTPNDAPALGSLAVRLAPVRDAAVPPFVMLPNRINDQNTLAQGQAGGWLGRGYDPMVIVQDPAAPDFHVEGFARHPDLGNHRLRQRRALLQTLNPGALGKEAAPAAMNEFQQQAFDLIASNRAQSAFNLTLEPASVRDRYGRTTFGQGCLLARRLIEAGARVVTVHDCTLEGYHDWDTHNSNFKKLRDELLPRLDLAYTALLEDLLARGLLDDTVVYLGGEFGRTPRVGQIFSTAGATPDGRDHYPNCFSGILTGGLSRRGIVYGATDATASSITRDPMTVADLAATLLAAMGLDPETIVRTRDDRPVVALHGQAVAGLLR